MDKCLFCQIANKKISSDIVYENESVVVFKDISPKAPVHLLVIPKKHINSIIEIDKLGSEEVYKMLNAIAEIAKDMGLDKDGFRVVINTGASAGQSVGHLHLHILAKRNFSWPPG